MQDCHGVIADTPFCWIIETNADTWERSGFAKMDEPQTLRALEGLFAEELAGHKLIANRSQWRNFPNIRNATWVMDKVVLVGDAKATAHFSIGSGTKLAMEDAIALYESLRTEGARAAAEYLDVIGPALAAGLRAAIPERLAAAESLNVDGSDELVGRRQASAGRKVVGLEIFVRILHVAREIEIELGSFQQRVAGDHLDHDAAVIGNRRIERPEVSVAHRHRAANQRRGIELEGRRDAKRVGVAFVSQVESIALEQGSQVQGGQRRERQLDAAFKTVGFRVEVVREIRSAKLAALVVFEFGVPAVEHDIGARRDRKTRADGDRPLRARSAFIDLGIQTFLGRDPAAGDVQAAAGRDWHPT